MNIERSEQYKEWQRSTAALMRSVHGGGSSTLTETREAKEKRIERARRDYPYFVQTYFPHIARCKSGRFQTDAAKYILVKEVLSGARLSGCKACVLFGFFRFPW